MGDHPWSRRSTSSPCLFHSVSKGLPCLQGLPPLPKSQRFFCWVGGTGIEGLCWSVILALRKCPDRSGKSKEPHPCRVGKLNLLSAPFSTSSRRPFHLHPGTLVKCHFLHLLQRASVHSSRKPRMVIQENLQNTLWIPYVLRNPDQLDDVFLPTLVKLQQLREKGLAPRGWGGFQLQALEKLPKGPG